MEKLADTGTTTRKDPPKTNKSTTNKKTLQEKSKATRFNQDSVKPPKYPISNLKELPNKESSNKTLQRQPKKGDFNENSTNPPKC